MKNNITAVAFDIDGTLYPSWRFYIKIFPFFIKYRRLMSAFSKTRKEIRVWQEANPEQLHDKDFFDFQAEIFARFVKEKPEELKNFLENEVYISWRTKFKKIKPYPKAKAAIEALKNKKLKIAVLSDFVPEQKNDIWGILPLCDKVLGSEYIGALKPSKLVFENLAKHLEVKPEEILYVGNNFEYDILGAKQVGMKTAYIANPISLFFHKISSKKNNEKADIYFSNYKQFLKQFNELTKE